jgi:hypothetical protein
VGEEIDLVSEIEQGFNQSLKLSYGHGFDLFNGGFNDAAAAADISGDG